MKKLLFIKSQEFELTHNSKFRKWNMDIIWILPSGYVMFFHFAQKFGSFLNVKITVSTFYLDFMIFPQEIELV